MNAKLTACGTFGNWLMKRRRVPENPFRGLEKLDAKTDRRRIRRAADDDEFFRLLTAAAQGPAFRGLSGKDRVVLYLVAVNTGFRVLELGSLTANSFDLSQEPASVTVEAAHAKNKRTTRQPLQSDVAAIVNGWLKNRLVRSGEESPVVPIRKPAAEPLWPGTWTEKAAKMLRRDLDSARQTWIGEAKTEAERQRREESDTLRYFDDQGHVLDFHALRHTFGTNLARCGVHPRTAQELMRHSDINLTMQTYTHVRLHDLTAAVESLPNLTAGKSDKSTEAMAAGSESDPPPPISVVPKVVPAPAKIKDSQSNAIGSKPTKTDGDQTTQAPEKSGACEDSCDQLRPIDQEPLNGFEPLTYALRMAT